MAETANAELGTSASNTENKKTKKAVSGGGKKPKSKPTHPPTAQMVNSAIKSLKERGGSSLPAIKKYLSANYKVDADKLAPFIKKFLKSAVASGKLIQTKGKGASGSFKLPSSTKVTKVTKVKSEGGTGSAEKKKSAVKKLEKKPKEKTTRIEKKKSTVSGISAAKSAKKTGSPKVKPSRPKQQKPKKEKAAKIAPKTPRAPKPKKLTAPKKVATKKAARK